MPWAQRTRAHLHYLRRPLGRMLPAVLALAALVLAGGYAFHKLYAQRPLSFAEGLYVTYCLLYTEHVIDFPAHWLLRAFHIVLPLLGPAVVLDGIVQFSYHILRRDEHGREWAESVASVLENHVVLCGLGRGGLRVLQELLRLGEQVAVLEKDDRATGVQVARRHGIPVFFGSRLDEGNLEALNVAGAKSIILSTSDDLANLEMALDARKLKPGIRVVLRMYDHDLAAKVRDSFGIDVAFSRSAISAPVFATSSSDSCIENAFYVGSRLLVVARLKIQDESQLVDTTVGAMRQEYRAFLVSHTRDGKESFWPADELKLRAGDRVVIETEPETLKRLHKVNRDQPPY